jgi:hypothetical protein
MAEIICNSCKAPYLGHGAKDQDAAIRLEHAGFFVVCAECFKKIGLKI